MTPLLPPSLIFHSSDNSKSPNSSALTKSSFLPEVTSAPPSTRQPTPGAVDLRLRQPLSDVPSNRSFQPSDCSDDVRPLVTGIVAHAVISERSKTLSNRGRFFIG